MASRVVPAIAVAVLALATTPSYAHKLTVFAAVEGKQIAGEAFFRGGSPVRHAAVSVLDGDGTKLGEIKTDDAGKFTFEPRARCVHRFVLDTGDGHSAEYTLPAEELPSSLPGGNTVVPAPAVKPETPTQESPKLDAEPEEKSQTSGSPPSTSVPSIADLSGQVEQTNREIVAMRRELAHYQDKVRLHDILGGIGCILGFMGLSFYFLGVRRKERLAGGTPQGPHP
jgi:nickel transport protein